MSCCGNCSACSGCGRELELTVIEMDFLRELGQVAFLPVARRADDFIPVYLEAGEEQQEQYSLVLQCLEKKNLISLDYDRPLKGMDFQRYSRWPVRGSIGLTARGQSVLELLEYQGFHS